MPRGFVKPLQEGLCLGYVVGTNLRSLGVREGALITVVARSRRAEGNTHLLAIDPREERDVCFKKSLIN